MLSSLRAALSPATRREWNDWISSGGVDVLRDLGMRPGDVIVDLGCGRGAHSLPAARLAGDAGRVAAVDVQPTARRRLTRAARNLGLSNIRTASSMEELPSLLDGRPCSAVLLYDMLHFMNPVERRRIYDFVRNLLGADGRLLVSPRHMRDNDPARFFRDMTAEDLISEIEEAGYKLGFRRDVPLWHNHRRESGTVLGFSPSNATPPGIPGLPRDRSES